MRVVAITGGIGSGKSTVTALYRSLGVPAVDADAISRALTAPNGEALVPLRDAFGDEVFNPDGTLNRAALGRRVFGGDARALQTLNAIMHPRIIRQTVAALQALRDAGAAIAILDVPLLFETGMDRLADTVICVTAPEAVRVRRIRGRDKLTAEEALRRIHSQNPMETTERQSDYVLPTDAPIADTRRRALLLWQQVLENGPRRPMDWFNPLDEPLPVSAPPTKCAHAHAAHRFAENPKNPD